MMYLKLYDVGNRGRWDNSVYLLEVHYLYAAEYYSGVIPNEWGPEEIN